MRKLEAEGLAAYFRCAVSLTDCYFHLKMEDSVIQYSTVQYSIVGVVRHLGS
jgi:hypothetical protein